MGSMKPLNRKEVKRLHEQLIAQFDYEGEFDVTLFVAAEDKYYIATRAVEEFLDSSLRIERIGVYFGQLLHGEFRLTLEGSQFVGPHARANILTLTPAQRDDWMLGKDIILDEVHPKEFHIVRCGEDFLGCGKFKNGVLLNYVPKERYVGTVFTDDDMI
jgi:NOL1/NOP2/fmu family ribosome biogenesis protein